MLTFPSNSSRNKLEKTIPIEALLGVISMIAVIKSEVTVLSLIA